MSDSRLLVTYRIASDPAHVAARAEAIALEQSVELPDAAVRDARVRNEVMGRVAAIRAAGDGCYEVDVALAEETIGDDAGQLLNMLFGNTSLHQDVLLADVALPDRLAQRFGGPRFGVAGIRAITARGRPLSCAALKPQGLPPAALAALATTYATACIDLVKDDHGLADQSSAPFAARVTACQGAIDAVAQATGHRAVYAPSLTGSLDAMRRQLDHARACGVHMAMVAPMVSGVSNLAVLAREAGMPLLAHPALAGAARIAPPLLSGKLFRLFGADATIFPHAGGRFGYSMQQCAAIADAARLPLHGLAPAMPVPAGGMSVERLPQLRELYGDDAIFLIGGSLLAGDDVPARCRAFVAAVAAPRTQEPTPHA